MSPQTKMKIELSPIKIVPGALTIWHQPGPDVDIVMDLRNLTFKENSIDEIYSFHVLDHLFANEVSEAIDSWKKVLKKGAKLFVVVDDFEYIARAYVGGDISMDLFNAKHSHPMNFSRESLVDSLVKAGFPPANMSVWFQDVPNLFAKEHYELVVSAQKT